MVAFLLSVGNKVVSKKIKFPDLLEVVRGTARTWISL